MNTDSSFGAWLQQRRRALELTQEGLAQRVGCSVASIRKFEIDRRRPSLQIAELLADVLSIPPAERADFVKLARGGAGMESSAPRPPAGPIRRTNLPTPPTKLIGRETELTEVLRLMNNPTCRLLTLAGLGGIGKTRLAIEVALAHHDAFADGAYFVSLASVNTAEYLVPAIADALGFVFYDTSDPKTQLLNYLREKEALLVLDNVEQLLPTPQAPLTPGEEPGLQVISEILQTALEVKLLTTSREPLNVQGEWVFEIQGLAVPGGEPAAGVEQYGAVTLFVERARRAQVGFELPAAQRPTVARICQLVTGTPLGIELAASWVRTLSCDEIAEEIQRNLDFLAVSARDVPERHRSLRAVFDHTWNLLTADERQVLMKLSVFRGGFRREAAEHVAGATLVSLSALAAKSLLRRVEAAGDQSVRYDLHELVRQYAESKLQADSAAYTTTRDRHCRYYTTLLQQRERALKSAEEKRVAAELGAEIDNVRSAWDWAVTHRRLVELRNPVRGLNWLYELRNALHEGILLFDHAVKALQTGGADGSGDERDVTLGRMLTQYGWFCFRAGRFGDAREALQRSLAILRSHDDPLAMADTLMFLGHVTHVMGDYEAGRRLLQQGIDAQRALGDTWSTALGLASHGLLALAEGEYREAQGAFRESARLWRSTGDPRVIAYSLSFLGVASQALNEYDEAQALLDEALVISREQGDLFSLGTSLSNLGLLAYARGRYAEAQDTFRQSIALFEEFGDRWSLAQAFNGLGEANLALGLQPAAQVAFEQGLQTALDAKTIPETLRALTGLAMVQVEQGQHEPAVELLSHVLQHANLGGEVKERAERLRAKLEQVLTSQQVEAARLRAQAETFDAVVQWVLNRG